MPYVILTKYKSYGGRPNGTYTVKAKCTYLYTQASGGIVVALNEDAIGHKAGHKIAVLPQNYFVSIDL